MKCAVFAISTISFLSILMLQPSSSEARDAPEKHPLSMRDCSTCPELRLIREGRFTMGSDEGVGDDDEHPKHEVGIDKPFYLGAFEVTRQEWAACVSEKACDVRPLNCESHGKCGEPALAGSRLERVPVTDLYLSDIRSYLIWLSLKSGFVYRLPTEEEWEFAARASTRTQFYWGEEASTALANVAGEGALPVGSYPPNPQGLFDISGNVWEIVEDCFDEKYGAVISANGEQPRATCDKRIIRGGSWLFEFSAARSANRGGATDEPDFQVGFRVARSAA